MDGETDVLRKDADCLRQAIQEARTRTRALRAVYGTMIAAPRAKGIAFLNCRKQGTFRSLSGFLTYGESKFKCFWLITLSFVQLCSELLLQLLWLKVEVLRSVAINGRHTLMVERQEATVSADWSSTHPTVRQPSDRPLTNWHNTCNSRAVCNVSWCTDYLRTLAIHYCLLNSLFSLLPSIFWDRFFYPQSEGERRPNHAKIKT